MFKTADDLRIRALEPSATQKLPAANEAKQRLSPRNHCRLILKGAPFIICSGCFNSCPLLQLQGSGQEEA